MLIANRAILILLALLCVSAWRSVRADDGNVRSVAQAGDPSPVKKSSLVDGAKGKRPAVTREQEQIVLEFVRSHHRELEGLLTHLRQHRPTEFQRAVRDIYRNVERIEGFREKDPERYQLELELWQTQSRSQLLAARITMADEAQLREQLRDLLEQQIEIRLMLLRRERDRVADRLARLNEQLDRMEQDRSANVERQLKTLLQGTHANKTSTSAAKSPAAKPRTESQNPPKAAQPDGPQ